VGSGIGQGADGGHCSGSVDATRIIARSICLTFIGFSHLQAFFGSWHLLQVLFTAGEQPQAGLGLLHTLHITAKPSSLCLLYFPNKYPPNSANIATNTNADIVYENLPEPFIPIIYK